MNVEGDVPDEEDDDEEEEEEGEKDASDNECWVMEARRRGNRSLLAGVWCKTMPLLASVLKTYTHRIVTSKNEWRRLHQPFS